MNKLYLFSIVLGIFFIAGSALATVGGPTYISEIAFNSIDNFVYYKVHDGGGRGCPPIINKINLSTLARSEVKSCTQFESEGLSYEEGIKKYGQFMHDTYQGLPYLSSVSLKKNNIDISVEFLSEHVEFDFAQWSDFRATLSQDGKKIGEINFRGCTKDQPHVFEGYMVPNSGVMAMLISNKGDCFEGGYVSETLHIIKDVKYYNTDIVRDMKTESATEPNTGNLVVYAGVSENTEPNINPVPETNTDDKKSNKNLYLILAVVVVLIFGLGYVLRPKIKS